MQQTVWLSIGNSRKELSWKNVEMTWPQLVEKVSKTVKTPETLKEYLAFKKDLQDERKDVGGFVGGPINGGRRKKEAIVQRYLLTLDIDFGDMDFWDLFQMGYNNAALIYGTHKHSERATRFRLVMPLSRVVTVDEYEALARKVAGNLDIEIFDPTTFQAERLMFWPSTPADQEYYFQSQEGPWLDVDKVLRSYGPGESWRDQSQWPISSKVELKRTGDLKKLGDPLAKEGAIGAFCRCYGITETIEKFLAKEYLRTDHEDRFTYALGSTYAGMVVYDDLFAYSHHSTDPAGGRLVNAFDLVRLHKFGHLDLASSDRTNIGKLPSTAKMLELAREDPEVKAELAAGKLREAKDSWFIEPSEVEELRDEEKDWDWLREMDIDKKGEFLTSYKNVELILENDPRIKGRIRFNELGYKMEVTGKMPWDRKRSYPRDWVDGDWAQMRKLMGKAPYQLLRTPKLEDVMEGIKENNRFHPIREYLESLVWDGEDRVDYVLIDFLGAEETDYVKTVTRKALVAAVARIMKPGVKFDHVLTMVGKQGIGKSSLVKKLGKGWSMDTFSFSMLHKGKEAFEQLRGQWLVEIGEMAGLRKADIEASKSFLSSTEDYYRPAYGREVICQKRQNIFIGSSNNPEFLRRFGGGNRRFWPVDCPAEPGANVLDGLTEPAVDQIWAEAVQLWKGGETLYLSPEMEAEAYRIQEEHEEPNDLVGVIQNYLDTLLPATWYEKTFAERVGYFAYKDELSAVGTLQRNRVSAVEIWCECLKKPKGDFTLHNAKNIHEIMREMKGWEHSKSKIRFSEYGVLIGYIREGTGGEMISVVAGLSDYGNRPATGLN